MNVEMWPLRDITEDDLAALADADAIGSTLNLLQEIRTPHHTLAQLLANGYTVVDAAAMTGFGPATVKSLKLDPAFQELLAHYGQQTASIDADIRLRMQQLGLATLEELQDRVLKDPSKLASKDLIDLAKLVLDRSGYGPSSTIQHDIGISTETLQNIKAAIDGKSRGKILEVPVNREPGVSVPGPAPGLVEEAKILAFSSSGDRMAEARRQSDTETDEDDGA
jgi:hypothetical protein